MQHDLQNLKQRIPLLDYLLRRNWTAGPIGSHQEFVGLCPLHAESRPSFYVNAAKDVFYCHGCGRSGDLIRFVQLSLNLSFDCSEQNRNCYARSGRRQSAAARSRRAQDCENPCSNDASDAKRC